MKWFVIFQVTMLLVLVYLNLHISAHCDAIIDLQEIVEFNSMTLNDILIEWGIKQ